MRNVSFSITPWPTKTPFRITGHTFTEARVLTATITENNATGHGEATGIYYLDETANSMLTQAESVKQALEQGASRDELQTLLPTGGARNAIDCALWDLEAKQTNERAWSLAGLEDIEEVITVNTVGIGTPEEMAAMAQSFDTPHIKVKLNGEQPLERIQAVRTARPDATIIVDVNQGWTFEQLVSLAPRFKELDIKMIEQPLPRGEDEQLEEYSSPITLCADESCLDSSELKPISRRYQMVNIKLDKTGGLTEALNLAQKALDLDMQLMVGNMIGTSLAMAPGFVIAQLCEYVDLDGILYLQGDCEHGMSYTGGRVSIPSRKLWG